MYAMPSAKQFAEAMSNYGVGEGTRVVLYDNVVNAFAARIWWMLRTFGFDNAAVLNGGWAKWTKEGRATSRESSSYPQGNFAINVRSELIANKNDVLNAIEDGQTCVLNALPSDNFAGPNPYGRSGHIPSSVNVSFVGMVDPDTSAYLPDEILLQQFSNVNATNKDKVITYCGGGIAASSAALILTLLGVENIAVYDGSMAEWAADPALPLVTG